MSATASHSASFFSPTPGTDGTTCSDGGEHGTVISLSDEGLKAQPQTESLVCSCATFVSQEMFRVLASVVLREDALPCVAHHCNGVVYCARQHWRKLKIEVIPRLQTAALCFPHSSW